ncbi:MAG: hypothetical protein BWX80_00194 [Candidatus Hydrogenedentes bacterium ADurb.Bin101]|nr:MAG: hypothetical protein BWX80_00194 [Candidatus Hydrogenedentes bacterium ADurb.Bin101]
MRVFAVPGKGQPPLIDYPVSQDLESADSSGTLWENSMTSETRNAFDVNKYLQEQTAAILERVERFDNKLYLEFGGKLIFDYHAARVLPGFDPNVKMRLLQQFKDKIDIILCIYAGDIARKKIRADFGITYDIDVLKFIDDLRKDWGLEITAVVITRYEEQPSALFFKNKLERRGITVYTHQATRGYPTDVDLIVSKDGYGRNSYIGTTHPLVVVTGPGPGSGKLGTCLSQLYHEYEKGIHAGYAKFETFPIWNLPLKHPVNVAYEAATADLRDINVIDPFHLEACGETTINYNRDVEAFPLLRRILEKITGEKSFYRSPTDMGVNRVGFGIADDQAVRYAAEQEVIRRVFRYRCEYMMGLSDQETVERVELIMNELGIQVEDRRPVIPAREAAARALSNNKGNDGIYCGAAIELKDGTIITGGNSPLMHAATSAVLNAIKHLAGIPDKIHLISPNIITAIGDLKKNIRDGKSISLDLEEALIAVGASMPSNPATSVAVEKLKHLNGCDMHMTHIPTPGDEAGLRRLGINLTSDPEFASESLYIT